MSRQPLVRLTGTAAPLMRANVDTDVIIRIERLTQLAKNDLGRYAFEALRYREDGSEDPNFALNQPAFRGAPILLAGLNFGCGSSREHAVWALQGIGVRCIIAPSFGDIFYGNCFQNGVLPIRLPLEQIELLQRDSGTGAPLTIDLEHCQIVTPSAGPIEFSIEAQRREALLSGLDDIALTLRHEAAIRAWQAVDRKQRPWAWPERASETLPRAVRLPLPPIVSRNPL